MRKCGGSRYSTHTVDRYMKLGGKVLEKGMEIYRDPTLAGVLAKEGGEIARELAYALALSDDPPTVLKSRLGVSKRVAWAEPLALEEVKAIGRAYDCTVNGELLAPQGHVGLIVEPAGALKIGDPYKAKCIGIHWEMMFARPRFKTANQGEQGRILDRVAELVDAAELRSTHAQTLGRIDAANLRRAHALLESGRTLGKIVLAGF